MTAERFHHVQKATQLPARRVRQAHARAGYAVPDRLAAAVVPKSRGEVEIDDSVVRGWKAPKKNPEILRFVLADSCYSPRNAAAGWE